MHIASAQQKEILKVCKQHKVKSLFAFGSVTRDDFNDDSDIDLVVDFEESDPFLYAVCFKVWCSFQFWLHREGHCAAHRVVYDAC